MSIRTVKYELEARLTGKAYGFFAKPSGKVERKSYDDGVERLKISLKNIKVPERSNAVVKAGVLEIVQITLTNGTGRLDNESVRPDSIPTLEAGQTIGVYINDELVLKGKLYTD